MSIWQCELNEWMNWIMSWIICLPPPLCCCVSGLQGDHECVSCSNLRDGPRCVSTCPNGVMGENGVVIFKYPNRLGHCAPCHLNCTQGWVGCVYAENLKCIYWGRRGHLITWQLDRATLYLKGLYPIAWLIDVGAPAKILFLSSQS